MTVNQDITTGFGVNTKALFLSCVITLIGILVIVGWGFDITFLKSLSPVMTSMKTNSAICFIVLGILLFILAKKGKATLPLYILSSFVAIIALISIAEYVFDSNIGIDELIFKDDQQTYGKMRPGRMSPITAINFLLLSASFIFFDKKINGKYYPGHILVNSVLVISLITFYGYFFNAKEETTIAHYTTIAFYTTLNFLLICVCYYFLRPNEGLPKLVFGKTKGGTLIRKMILPLFVLFPIVVMLRIKGQELGLYNTGFGAFLMMIVTISMFTWVFLSMSKQLNYAEIIRKEEDLKLNESQKLFSTVFYQSPVMNTISEISTGKYIDVNDRFVEFIGYKKEEIIGKTSLDLKLIIQPKYREEILRILNTQGYITDVLIEILSKTGHRKWVSSSIHKVEINGKHYFISVMIDVTKRMKAEEKLKETNYFLNTILDNIPNMIFVKDAKELRFLKFNKAGEKLLGYDFRDLYRKNDYDFFPKEQADFFIAKDREVLDNKVFLDIPEEPIQTPHGKRWLHTQKIPVLDEQGKPIYLIGISEDITERKKQDDKISKLNKELQSNNTLLLDVNKELEAFTYTVSHDLRAPLRAVNGYSQMLKEDYGKLLTEDGNRILQTIQHNALKMGRLIDDLLSFSRLGRQELHKIEIDMNALVEVVINDITKSITHKAEFKISKLPNIKGDYNLLQQAFFNLIANAVKFSSKKVHPLVEIYSEENNKEVIYTIKDNGVGFNMDYVNKLFTVFQRLHAQEEFEGTGVGLAIVQRVVNKHGGKVWAEGKIDEGAIFKISLPKTKKR